MAEPLVFGLRRVTREVPTLGRCTVTAPSGAVEGRLADAADAGDPAAYVSALLSATLVTPRLSRDEVAALPEPARPTSTPRSATTSSTAWPRWAATTRTRAATSSRGSKARSG